MSAEGRGLEALHKAGSTTQLEPVVFVPAQYPDTIPIPEGIDIIRLGRSAEVCTQHDGMGGQSVVRRLAQPGVGQPGVLVIFLPYVCIRAVLPLAVQGSTAYGGRGPVTFGADERWSNLLGPCFVIPDGTAIHLCTTACCIDSIYCVEDNTSGGLRAWCERRALCVPGALGYGCCPAGREAQVSVHGVHIQAREQ